MTEETKINEVPESTNEDETMEEIIEDIVKQKPAGSRDKNNLYEEIEIPEGINASIDNDVLTVSKDGKEIKRVLVSLIDVKIKDNKNMFSPEQT